MLDAMELLGDVDSIQFATYQPAVLGVQAALGAIMVEKREQARQLVRAVGPTGYWVGGWRTAPEFLAPKFWDRFVWPYLKELVEIVAEEGGTPDEVHAYFKRLINEVGAGALLAQGCAIPPDAKLENVRSMVDAVQ